MISQYVTPRYQSPNSFPISGHSAFRLAMPWALGKMQQSKGRTSTPSKKLANGYRRALGPPLIPHARITCLIPSRSTLNSQSKATYGSGVLPRDWVFSQAFLFAVAGPGRLQTSTLKLVLTIVASVAFLFLFVIYWRRLQIHRQGFAINTAKRMSIGQRLLTTIDCTALSVAFLFFGGIVLTAVLKGLVAFFRFIPFRLTEMWARPDGRIIFAVVAVAVIWCGIRWKAFTGRR
jgi:hypothetical protein